MKFLPLLTLFVLISCTQEEPVPIVSENKDGITVEGNMITVSAGLRIPEMNNVATRTLGDNPDLEELHLYVLEFADNGDPYSNTLIGTHEAEEERVEGNLVKFKLKLTTTTDARILHLIALPKSESLKISYGVEGSIIPHLTVPSGIEAYWRRISFPSGYSYEESEGVWKPNPELASKLREVPLIRNFAKITVNNSAANFRLLGFEVFNVPVIGSIAPWNAENKEFPEFLNTNGKPLLYTTLNSNYNGLYPAGATLTNLIDGPTVPEIGDNMSPRYIYERPFSSIDHTFIIVKGVYNNQIRYYKLDIGKEDSDAIFRYYNLLRNYNYNITIRSVKAAGYATVAEAAKGVVYNNLSFDIDTESMLNMSDGSTEIVYVNFTTKVLTNPDGEVIQFKYRYKNITGTGPTYNNGNVNFIDLNKGSVIKNVVYTDTDDGEGWRTVYITINPAKEATEVQSFIIVKPNGLGRRINLVLHSKWEFDNLKIYGEYLTNWTPSMPEGIISPNDEEPVTIFFDLPNYLPETLFPLRFVLESNRQNLDDDPRDNMVVGYGESFFRSELGLAENELRIQFTKTITWKQYNDALSNDPISPGGTLFEQDGHPIHRVSCRMRTITKLSELDITNSHTTVIIKNDNYEPGKIEFDRKR